MEAEFWLNIRESSWLVILAEAVLLIYTFPRQY